LRTGQSKLKEHLLRGLTRHDIEQTEDRVLKDINSDKGRQITKCTNESRVAVAMGQGQFGNSGKGTYAVRSRYSRPCEELADWEDSVRVCSELQTVRIGDSARVSYSEELECAISPVSNQNPNVYTVTLYP
jgi:hypothetical protein